MSKLELGVAKHACGTPGGTQGVEGVRDSAAAIAYGAERATQLSALTKH